MHCGRPVKDGTQELCPACAGRKSYIAQGRSLWIHREPVSGAVYRFKYKNRRSWGRIFAEEMAEHCGSQIVKWGIDVMIPIPVHAAKKRKRGFNQAEVLARELAELTGIPWRGDVLLRIRNTAPLKSVGGRERAESLRGAFAVKGKWRPCKNVLLIDDIYTTGATVERAAKMLKKAGVQNVYFLTISIGQGI